MIVGQCICYWIPGSAFGRPGMTVCVNDSQVCESRLLALMFGAAALRSKILLPQVLPSQVQRSAENWRRWRVA